MADFNGDGTPDVALAGGIGYVVFDGKKLVDPTVQTGAATILSWADSTTDCSSAQTGSTVFDFQGTGKAQVVYSDEENLRIYDGPTGNVLFHTCNTTGTLVEFPVVADVDNDGHADIVVVSNAYASGTAEYQCNDGTHIAQSGVRDLRRRQRHLGAHARRCGGTSTPTTSPTSPPTAPSPSTKAAQLLAARPRQLPPEQAARPRVLRARTAVISIGGPSAPGPDALVATVRNIGQAALPARRGHRLLREEARPLGTLLGQAMTTTVLYPAQSEDVVFPLDQPGPGAHQAAPSPVYAVRRRRDAARTRAWHECRTDNKTSVPVSAQACQTAH